jgi:hypothetical protein
MQELIAGLEQSVLDASKELDQVKSQQEKDRAELLSLNNQLIETSLILKMS